ncbi:PH domain-containing protein [Streptomyces sp. NPDC088763]|uniref:PH domain-containing protein n=1 Tax=Streptomyces sp. NPDC088763 TaxID=3365892 RepID=UPI0038094F62
MSSVPEVTCRPRSRRFPWFLVGLGAAGLVLALARAAGAGGIPDAWALAGCVLASLGVAGAYGLVIRVHADASGLSYRTLLHRRGARWDDVADVRVRVRYARHGEIHRVHVVMRGGRTWRLPLPVSSSAEERTDFDATVEALRALHQRYGTPESDHLAVLSKGTAGRGVGLPVLLCALFLAGAALAAWFVPVVAAEKLAWTSAVPCAGQEAGRDEDCLTTLSAVVARTEVAQGRGQSFVYFDGGRPVDRVSVSKEGAGGFRAGDRVRLTVWRDGVREIAGGHHVWREHFPAAGEVAVTAAVCVLIAGYPAALIAQRRRARRRPADELLPSPLPFAGALAGTAVWSLPYCYTHPTLVPGSPGGVVWAGLGAAVSVGLFVWAWRATRLHTPGAATPVPVADAGDEDVFLSARFLESTEYNPHGFGTHIVLGAGGPAVLPHSGPGRFAARPIPVERLTVRTVRRPRGGDGDTVPSDWDIAELDDEGRLVRLAAAPGDLARILRAFTADDGTPVTAAGSDG